MKRIFRDADKKYTWHISKLKKKIKQLHKSQIALAILATGIIINGIYLTILWICGWI